MKQYQITSGRSYPLGATKTDTGVNFALFSANAEKVFLCLFDQTGENEIQQIELPEFTDDVWHGHVENMPNGSLYGYRVFGPYTPHEGHRFNPHKLLLDPYAKKLHGQFIEHESNYGYDAHSPQPDLTLDCRDNAAYVPKAVVVEPMDVCSSHPQIRRRDTIIYELHVKGISQLHPDIPKPIRGTYRALSHPSLISHLKSLGITSIELLPVHEFIDESFALNKGLVNYWGYNSIAFFALAQRYNYSGEIAEFRQLVEAFHQADIEIILDVVYNHTAEGNELGATYSFKGIDNASYYRLLPEDKRYYKNYSGCGNTLNIRHPRVLQLVTDSLRYWVEQLGVDGFRFDLAPILGRKTRHFDQDNNFFAALRQDPVLSKVKLIAEPWDIGQGGYQLGRFPNSWLEWNDRFRDTCRRFWRGDEGMVPELARRLHGSADLFEQRSRRPSSSVNFITSHDGFTLHDLVSFNTPHNHANGEENRDGHKANFSFNCGEEGPSDNAVIVQLRAKQKRNLLTTLFIAQGTPMILSGDELANSQQGNNNAYCQDNEIAWLNWHLDEQAQADLNFVKKLIALRKAHPLLNRSHYQHGTAVSNKTQLPDISWLNCQGNRMSDKDWHNQHIRCFAMLLANTDHEETGHTDDALLIIFNAHNHTITYTLPTLTGQWQLLVNTEEPSNGIEQNNTKNQTSQPKENTQLEINAHSCCVLSYSQTSSADKPTTTSHSSNTENLNHDIN